MLRPVGVGCGCLRFGSRRGGDESFVMRCLLMRSVCVRYIHCKRYIFLTVQEIVEDMGATATIADCQRDQDIFMCRKYLTQQKPNNNSSSFSIIQVHNVSFASLTPVAVKIRTRRKKSLAEHERN